MRERDDEGGVIVERRIKLSLSKKGDRIKRVVEEYNGSGGYLGKWVVQGVRVGENFCNIRVSRYDVDGRLISEKKDLPVWWDKIFITH